MLKQTLIIASLFALTATSVLAEPTKCKDCAKTPKQVAAKMTPEQKAEFKAKMEQKRAEFETRIQLTDEQKAQAKVIRENSAKEMKPLMEKKKATFAKIKTVKTNEKLSDEQKAKKMKPLKKEMRAINKQMKEIRVKNQAEFEAILTDAQKAELAKMKEEGKKKYEEMKKAKKQNKK